MTEKQQAIMFGVMQALERINALRDEPVKIRPEILRLLQIQDVDSFMRAMTQAYQDAVASACKALAQQDVAKNAMALISPYLTSEKGS